MHRLGRLTASPGAAAVLTVLALLLVGGRSFAQADAGLSVDEQVRRNLHVERYSVQALAVQAAEKPRDLLVGLTLDGVVSWLKLKPHSLRSPNFKLLVADAKGRLTAVEPPEENTYRGVIDGLPGSGVAASIVNGQFKMLIDDGAQSWWVQPLGDVVENADAGAHVVYRQEDVLPGPWTCGMDGLAGALPKAVMAAAPEGAISCYHKAEIAFDTDVEYVSAVGAANVDADIAAVMIIVDFIYRRDCGITYEITQTIVRTAVFAPYTSTDAVTLRDAFRDEWNANNGAIPRDVAHLMTGKELDFEIIGIAYFDGICTTSAYALSQTLFSTNLAERVTLTAHELGHNWNAQHCDSSASPGFPQACTLPVANCSIMCHQLGGCPDSITLRFEPCSAQTIMNYRNTLTCLGPAGAVGLGTEKIVANDSQLNDNFGQAVSMSGDLLVVGAPQVDVLIPPQNTILQPDAGAAYIFRFNKTTSEWTQEAKLTAPDVGVPQDDRFGISVAAASLAAGSVNEDIVVIGAHLDDDFGRNSGAAYVFQRIAGVWTFVTKLTAVDGAPNDLYGFSVSITSTGNVIAVGSQRDDDVGINSGSVYVYRHNGATWAHEDKIIAPDATVADGFGFSVSVSGGDDAEVLLAGALFDDDQGADSGAAYVFRRDAQEEWLFESKLLPTGGAAGDQFGLAVSLYAVGLTEVALIGAPLTNVGLTSNTGAAYVFTSSGATWSQAGGALLGDSRAEDQFGAAVAVTGQIAVVGDYLDDPVGVNSGSAFVFRNTGLGYAFDTKLIPDDAMANDQFGIAVTAYGERAAIGSWKSESPATDGGAVYVTADVVPFVDCNMNGSPDECDISLGYSQDCNLNAIPDECDIAAGTSEDCNLNGVPDECDTPDPADDCNGNGLPDLCDIGTGFSQDCNLNAIPDECDIADSTSEDCNLNSIPDECDIATGASEDCNINGIPDECEVGGSRPDCNGNGIPDGCEIAGGTAFDCNANGVPDECDIPGTRNDCNNNSVPDSCDIAFGGSFDCNANGVPDECDLTGSKADCNANGIPDSCDIAGNFSEDCNLNGIPDECELPGNDCNTNDIPDDCEIAQGLAQDCNLNLIPDDCDIALGTSLDANSDGIPDECQKVLPCDGDLTGSGTVDIDDLLIIIGAWGTCPPCPGDSDGNGVVDIDEILALIAGWGVCPGCAVDFDGNGVVDIDDLLQIVNSWGACPPCEGDLNGDGFVNIDDLLVIIGGWGPCP